MRGGTATLTIRVRVMPDGKVFIERPSGTKGPTVPLPDLATAGAWLMDTLAAAYGASRKAKRLARTSELLDAIPATARRLGPGLGSNRQV